MSAGPNPTAIARVVAGRAASQRPKSIDSGTERCTERKLVFTHPFTLGGSRDAYPAGRYIVEFVDEAHVGALHTAYVRTSTVLIVPTNSGTRHVQVDPNELESAIRADAERELGVADSENPDSGLA